MTSYLNIENIERSTAECEWHPLRPFLPRKGRVLFLGSFPPQRKRWCMDFYYPNFINDHWRIEGEVFYGDREHFIASKPLPDPPLKGREKFAKAFDLEAIIEHCERYGIGFYDTATAVRRLKDNASDKFLEVVVPTDIRTLVAEMPELRAIVVTGEKAAETICQMLNIAEVPKVNAYVEIPSTSLFSPPLMEDHGVGLELYRLPSSSRAYPLAFDKKVEAYRRMFERYIDM